MTPRTTPRTPSPPNQFVMTFCEPSKTHRVAGDRSRWLAVTGPTHEAGQAPGTKQREQVESG